MTLRPLAALALALACAACGGGAGDGRRTVVFWALGREGEVVRELAPEFERLNPDLRLRVQQIPWTAAHEKLLTAFVGRSTPDVAQIGNTWVPEFVALDALEPLDARLARSTIDRKDFFGGVWDANVMDGTTWGVPWYVDTRVLFYRRDILAKAGFAAPPTTWSGLLDELRAVKRLGGAQRTAILLPLDEWAQPVILGFQQGSTLLADGGRRGAFSAPEFRRAAEFYLKIFDEGLAPGQTNTQVANLYQQFAAGEFSFYISGPWNLGEFRRRLPPELQDAWATAPLPAPDGKPFPGASLAGGATLVVFRGAANRDDAFRLLEFLSSPEVEARFYALSGDLPPRAAAWKLARLDEDERARAFWTQLGAVRRTPQTPEWEQIAAMVAERLETAVRGAATLDEALRALDRDVDRALEKRRLLLDRRAARGTK